MKFLVLTLCVCYASAATFSANANVNQWQASAKASAVNPSAFRSQVQPVNTRYVSVVDQSEPVPVQPFAKNVASARFGVTPYGATPYGKAFAEATVKPVVSGVPVVPEVSVADTPEPVAAVKNVAFASVKNVGVKTVGNTNDVNAAVLRSESEVNPDGFNYVYETDNGITAQATANLKKVDNVDAIQVQGSYAYVAPDGTPVEITYVADENGYQPRGAVIPVAPPVPVAILRSLEYIAAHPVKETYVKN